MKLFTKVPNDIYIACSGGVDSMVMVDFYRKGRKNIELLFMDHGTETSKEAREFLVKFSESNNIKLHIGGIINEYDTNLSKEEYWRNERYNFFKKFTDKPIIMAHHLGDQIENWVMTALHGYPKLIPPRNGNIVRPFVLVYKEEILDYAKRKNLQWCEDKSNADIKYVRNRVRHNIIPECLKIQQGLGTVISKIIIEKFKND